jgi:MraZ protein
MVNEVVNSDPAERPRGVCHTKLDEKGRVKLSTELQRYMAALGYAKFFITTLEGTTGRIYPISVWNDTEKFLSEGGEDSETAEHILFIAKDLGGDAELDSQGRVLVPADLRRALDIENKPVHLMVHRGHIKILSDTVYEARRQRAMQNPDANVRLFEQKGLQ